jgi:GR25 family glycosyltransferase involved in LPS biosynthesis
LNGQAASVIGVEKYMAFRFVILKFNKYLLYIMKILVIHYDKLVERKKHMLEQLKKYNLECDFISNWGKDKLTLQDKKKFINLTDSEISLTLHHFECYKQISENYDYAIIFEDDVLLGNNFKETIEKYISQLQEDWDMLFFGEGHEVHIPNYRLKNDINVYKKMTSLNNKIPGSINGSTRCADSYIVSKKCAKKIYEIVSRPNYIVTMPLDHLLNYINDNNKFNIYWAEPTITVQGSRNKIFNSSLRL